MAFHFPSGMCNPLAFMAETLNVLFVCVGNCVRSQMAEAIARHSASDVIAAESAGIRPLGFIDPTAKSVLEQRGISMDGQFSKGLHSHALQKADLIVNMSGVASEKLFHGHAYEDWPIPDPFGESSDTHCRTCDEIESRIKELAARLRGRNGTAARPAGNATQPPG
jgi:protein-tyrosine-phosphatase